MRLGMRPYSTIGPNDPPIILFGIAERQDTQTPVPPVSAHKLERGLAGGGVRIRCMASHFRCDRTLACPPWRDGVI
jgi:hypothetical protein